MAATGKLAVVGVDVSKEKLDVAWRKRNGFGRSQVANTRAGIASLLKMLRRRRVHVVVEATGSYSSLVHEVLTDAGCAVTVANPKRVRDFARGIGTEAKTDVIDAELLVRFGEVVEPTATPLPNATRRELRDAVVRRSQLVVEMHRNRNQRESAGASLGPESFDAVDAVLTGEIKKLEKRIRELLNHADLRGIAAVLKEQAGVADVVASTLIALVPELGGLGGKQLTALIGLAPFAKDSGQMQHKRHIRGGRTEVRNILYMAATSAMRHDAVLRAFRERLLAAGKTRKQAIIAVAHKLLVWLNARIRDLMAAGAGQSPLPASETSA